MKEIKISDYARQQIRRLFSQRNSVNTLKRDPELTQIFDNFAFDEALKLTPPVILSLEQALDFISDDELVEVTPKSIRLRKLYLTELERRRRRVHAAEEEEKEN